MTLFEAWKSAEKEDLVVLKNGEGKLKILEKTELMTDFLRAATDHLFDAELLDEDWHVIPLEIAQLLCSHCSTCERYNDLPPNCWLNISGLKGKMK
jgi:hypothetical protein